MVLDELVIAVKQRVWLLASGMHENSEDDQISPLSRTVKPDLCSLSSHLI